MPIAKDASINVLGGALAPCSTAPMTGFFRNGACDTCAEDRGSHTVCAVMTNEFLAYTPSPAEAEFDVLTVGFGTIQLCA